MLSLKRLLRGRSSMDRKQETIDTYNASAKALADKLSKGGAVVL